MRKLLGIDVGQISGHRVDCFEVLGRHVQVKKIGVVRGTDDRHIVNGLHLEEPRYGVDWGRQEDRDDEGGGGDPELDAEEWPAQHDVPSKQFRPPKNCHKICEHKQ